MLGLNSVLCCLLNTESFALFEKLTSNLEQHHSESVALHWPRDTLGKDRQLCLPQEGGQRSKNATVDPDRRAMASYKSFGEGR